MTQDTFEWPLDLGIVRFCTNDDIWAAEIGRHEGLMALRSYCACRNPGACGIGNDRHHFQKAFRDNEPALLELMEIAAPHYRKSREEIAQVLGEHMERRLEAAQSEGLLAKLFGKR